MPDPYIMIQDTTEITYRKATDKDINMLVDYRIKFLKEIMKSSPDLEIELRSSLAEYFLKSIRKREFVAWIAMYNQQPIAFSGMVIQTIPGHFTFITGKQGYILNMYTIPEARKKGVGSALVKRLLIEARKANLSKLCLHTTKDGINIYKKAGFKETPWPYLELSLK